MKAPLENPLFLSPIRPLLAAFFLTSPVAYALKENFLSFEGVFPLDFPVLPEEALPVLVASFLLFLYSLFRAIQALTRLRARAALAGFPSEFLSSERLYRLIKHIPADSVYLGRGFVWTPELANTAYRLTDAPLNPYTIPASLRALLTGTRGKDAEAIGQGWLHGIGPSEGPVFLTGKAADGGTLIVGTTQSGKGVLLTLLISEAIFRGEPVLIIDPKNSPRTLAALQRATDLAGHAPPLVFHPTSDTGVRMNLLANYGRLSEIASRITWCLNETGPFVAFAWKAVYTAASLLVASGKPITLAALSEALAGGPIDLVFRTASYHFGQSRLLEEMALTGKKGEREQLQCVLDSHLTENPDPSFPFKEALSLLTADPEHEAKLIAGLQPLLTSLTAGPLAESLSPTSEDPLRPLMSLKRLVKEKGVLYVATDALADSFTASSVATLLLADLAGLAAARYNTREPPTRIHLFIDEASNAMSEALIEILNKGAEAGIRTTCAMQTVSDLTARLKSEAAARMALGNFNNLIALRTKDLETARFAIETFGRTKIASTTTGLVSQSASDAPGRFSAGFTRRETSERESLLEASWLGRLPNTEYFASLAGATLVKGRVPIVSNKD